MKVIHGLSLGSKEGVQIGLEKNVDDEVVVEIEDANFGAEFVLPRRQCREIRDWLNVVLDD